MIFVLVLATYLVGVLVVARTVWVLGNRNRPPNWMEKWGVGDDLDEVSLFLGFFWYLFLPCLAVCAFSKHVLLRPTKEMKARTRAAEITRLERELELAKRTGQPPPGAFKDHRLNR